MNETPSTRAEAREAGILPDGEPAFAELEVISDPSILPLWMRRVFYVVGVLAGAAALIVGQYDAELARNIAGAGVILVGSLALANPSR
ncbi:hypothetical protein NS234_07415 [Microbacterium oxydans]|uniref:hypothetical protein n=1 Tax=Microbacterium oxydans TaxID=82380 RepID=UPI000734E334|nr:hypothetical protein [Microbacterium oxydans]KTR77426.1 hypothetical protein NS234_07415 [Microbacterium oxydans]